MERMRATTVAILGLMIFGTACSHSSTTSPSATSSSTSTTTTPAAPTVSESFTGTLPVGGFRFFTFNIAANGTVNVTLNSVSGAGVPPTVQLGLGIGQPWGIDCPATTNVPAGVTAAAPQARGTFGPGLFCVRV